ncbi:hypothetical protein ACWV26_06950 [Rummeliibacillus sp. JY-2-4R]
MVKSDGKLLFNGILVLGLIICSMLGYFFYHDESSTTLVKRQSSIYSIDNPEQWKRAQARFIHKATDQLEESGYPVGFILYFHSDDLKVIEAIVKSEIKEKKQAKQKITQTIKEVAKENHLGEFVTKVKFLDEE